MTAAKTLILMACSASKLETERPVPLLELYQGPMWKTLRANLGAVPAANVCVLSGGLGFRNAQTYARPYNKRLSPEAAAELVGRGIHERPAPAKRDTLAGPSVYQEAHRLAGGLKAGYELVVYERVIIAAPGLAGLYARTLAALVAQLKAAGLVAPGAEILVTSGGILAQCGQLKRWLGELQPKPELAPLPAPPAAPALLEVPSSVSWPHVTSPLEKKRARAAGRTPTKAAPLLNFNTAQGSLF